MELEVLRKDMIVSQRKGQPFIVTSTIIWVSITLVTMMKVSLPVQNLLIFLLFMSIVATLLVCWEMAECWYLLQRKSINEPRFLIYLQPIDLFIYWLLCGSLVRYLKKCLWFIQWFLERIFYPIHGYINQEHILFLLFWFRYLHLS